MNYTWQDAKIRYLQEMSGKKSIEQDRQIFERIAYWRALKLYEIRFVISSLINNMQKKGNKPATINRTLSLIKTILNKAKNEWEWIDKVPFIKLLKVNNARTRWLTKEEAKRMLTELPQHLALMAEFALNTGLRNRELAHLKWSNLQYAKDGNHTIFLEETKNGKLRSIPLNKRSKEILSKLKDDKTSFIFNYKGKPISQCNTRAFRKALRRAGITDFRWHDLRHTWASWHINAGTPLHVLQKLGGWSKYDMCLRYAHLDDEELKKAQENIL